MSAKEITLLLNAAKTGDPQATEALFNVVYAELKAIARSNRQRWQGNLTMNTTALIHEVFIKFAGREEINFENRTHFYATASKAMRQVLVNYATQQRTQKRGGDALRVTLDDSAFSTQASADELLAIHKLLSELELQNPRRARIVECRVFADMTVEEVAEALGISTPTVKREWRLATAWLYDALNPDAGENLTP